MRIRLSGFALAAATAATILAAAAPGLAAVTPVSVTVSPATYTIRLGAAPKQFSASVSGATNKAVEWQVNNVKGGNATVGTISATGLYAPPANVPATNAITVKAVSLADPTKSATSALTILNAIPTISALSPSSVNTDLATVVRLTGTNYRSGARVLLDNAPVTTKLVSATELEFTLKSTAAAGTKVAVTVEIPNPGAAVSSARTLSIVAPVAVSVSPSRRTIRGGATYDFSSSVSNNANKEVDWFVETVKGGNATLGTIDADGLYTAPVLLPAAPTVLLKAVSKADPRASATSEVTLQNPVPALTSTTPASLPIGAYSLTVRGTGFARAAKVLLAGAETTATWVSATELRVQGTMAAQPGGIASLTVVNPDPGTATSSALLLPVKPARELLSLSAAARLLEQATWGPSPASLAKLQETGASAWLDQQFAAPPSTYPDPIDTSEGLSRLQKIFVHRAVTGEDQLRQRVAFALAQILVVSGIENDNYHEMVPYLRILQTNAFGNYHTLLREIALSPSMGIFLDMVNNDKPDPKRNFLPNENFARELLQLFTIGLYALNPDGSRQADPQGNPIPAYTETTVKQLTLALTGWTFPPQPGFVSKWTNPRYFFGQMVPFEEHHDQGEKALLNGVVLPAGRTAREDFDSALANIFNHPNVGPFVSYRLIQRLVTSAPSPAYVARVAAVFNNNGAGVRGDLKAVVRAILTDAEAGNSAAFGSGSAANLAAAPVLAGGQGHLREPVLYAIGLLRALNATVTEEPSLSTQTQNMGQRLLYPPSVFSYFSPSYRIPGLGVVAPEFQVLNPSTALARANFVHRLVRNGISSSIQVSLANLEGMANDPPALVDAVGRLTLRGQMPAEMRASILKALEATTDKRTRARNALYLAATSSLYQVQR